MVNISKLFPNFFPSSHLQQGIQLVVLHVERQTGSLLLVHQATNATDALARNPGNRYRVHDIAIPGRDTQCRTKDSWAKSLQWIKQKALLFFFLVDCASCVESLEYASASVMFHLFVGHCFRCSALRRSTKRHCSVAYHGSGFPRAKT